MEFLQLDRRLLCCQNKLWEGEVYNDPHSSSRHKNGGTPVNVIGRLRKVARIRHYVTDSKNDTTVP